MWLLIPIKPEPELCSLVTVFQHKAKKPVNVSISNANWPLDGTLETAVCSSQKVVCVWEHKPPIKNGLTQHLVDYMDTTSMTASLSATDSTHAETYDHVYTFQIEIQSMLSVYIGPQYLRRDESVRIQPGVPTPARSRSIINKNIMCVDKINFYCTALFCNYDSLLWSSPEQ